MVLLRNFCSYRVPISKNFRGTDLCSDFETRPYDMVDITSNSVAKFNGLSQAVQAMLYNKYL